MLSIGPCAGFMSFSPLYEQIELECAGAPVRTPEPENSTPGMPGRPVTSPAQATPALPPTNATAQMAAATNFVRIMIGLSVDLGPPNGAGSVRRPRPGRGLVEPGRAKSGVASERCPLCYSRSFFTCCDASSRVTIASSVVPTGKVAADDRTWFTWRELRARRRRHGTRAQVRVVSGMPTSRVVSIAAQRTLVSRSTVRLAARFRRTTAEVKWENYRRHLKACSTRSSVVIPKHLWLQSRGRLRASTRFLASG